MLMFTLSISCLATSSFILIHGPNTAGSYAILFFTTSDFTFTTRHIYNWALFLLWLSLFISSGGTALLFSSSILSTYWPGEFIFQCHIHLPFHTVHRVLKARMLKWFAIPFSGGPHFVQLSTITGPSWVALHGMAHSFTESDKAVIYVIYWLVFCDCGFHSVCPLMDEDKRLVEASLWERLAMTKTGSWSALVGKAMLSKSLT